MDMLSRTANLPPATTVSALGFQLNSGDVVYKQTKNKQVSDVNLFCVREEMSCVFETLKLESHISINFQLYQMNGCLIWDKKEKAPVWHVKINLVKSFQ